MIKNPDIVNSSKIKLYSKKDKKFRVSLMNLIKEFKKDKKDSKYIEGIYNNKKEKMPFGK
jgi:hypothetical protein